MISDSEHKLNRSIHPWKTANLFSKLVFLYTIPLIKKQITEENVYEILDGLAAKKSADDLEMNVANDIEIHGTCSLYRVLWKTYGKKYVLIGFIQLIARSISVITIPLCLGKLVLYFIPNQSDLTKQHAYIYAALIIGLNILNCLYLHNYLLFISVIGIKIRTAFSSLIYRKCLRLSSGKLNDFTSGKMMTLIQKDVRTLEAFICLGNDIWIGIVQAIIVSGLIYSKIGIAGIVGCAVFIIIVPIQSKRVYQFLNQIFDINQYELSDIYVVMLRFIVILGQLTSKYRTEINECGDQRFEKTKEILSAIKIIKMYNWEMFFEKEILKARRKEIRSITKLFIIKTCLFLLGGLTSRIAFYLLFMIYLWTNHTLGAGETFFILSSFQKLRQAFSVIIPKGIAQCAEVRSVIKRMENVLRAQESNEEPLKEIDGPRVRLKNIHVGNGLFIDGEVDIEKNGLIILSGPNGSGKTTLLKLILGKLVDFKGEICISGRISYAPQEPWLFPSTIRQNILFGEKFNANRYWATISVCCLKDDIANFPDQDETIIEDKGMNLSKGQQTRIALARAIYKNSDIYLLDDCLASLDAQVQTYIFENCIQNFLKDKIRIIVTRDIENGSRAKVTHIENNEMNYENTFRKMDKEGSVVEDEENQLQNDLFSGNVEEDKLLEPIHQKKIYAESNNEGRVSIKCYKQYIRAGGTGLLSFSVFFAVAAQAARSLTDKIISVWVISGQNTSSIISYSSHLNQTTDRTNNMNISVQFSLLIFLGTALSIVAAFLLFTFTRNSSKIIHQKMLRNILDATLRFFETNFLGNILNRFSKDLMIIDEELPMIIYEFIEILMITAGILMLIVTTNILFLVPEIVLLVCLCVIRHFYMPVGRNLQRLDTATRSSIMGHLNATLDGLSIIQTSSNACHILSYEFDRHQDLNTSSNFTSECCARAFGFFLDMICCIFIAFVVLSFLIYNNDVSVGNVGLAITQSMMLTGLFQYGIRVWANIETKMTSTERVLDYTKLPSETTSIATVNHPKWLQSNSIKYENVNVFSATGTRILEDINLEIAPGEKIGIIGRTGSGKTTLISVLFKLYQFNGKILIDNTDINLIDSHFLRKRIGIIPQDPVLFSGTIRTNIDPTSQVDDETIWRVIKQLDLTNIVKSLDQNIADIDLSFGEKQLFCLARVLINNYKIVVLDEATSNIDEQTEKKIRNVFESHFFDNVTVLIITHKLKAIFNFNRIIIISGGKLSGINVIN